MEGIWAALSAGLGVAVLVLIVAEAMAADRLRLERALGISRDRATSGRSAAVPYRPPSFIASLGRIRVLGWLAGRARSLEFPPFVPAEVRASWLDARAGYGVLIEVLVLAGAILLHPLALVLTFAVPWAATQVVRARLDGLVRERRRAIGHEIAPALDVFALAMEAGLPFERAVTAYVQSADSVLAHELGTTVRELEVGYRRREVLHRLVARTGAPSLAALASAVRLGDEFGTPLAVALRRTAQELRARRRQNLQEAALRAPLTMLVPTALFILVPIFAIVLGPVALRVAGGSLF